MYRKKASTAARRPPSAMACLSAGRRSAWTRAALAEVWCDHQAAAGASQAVTAQRLGRGDRGAARREPSSPPVGRSPCRDAVEIIEGALPALAVGRFGQFV